MLQKTPTPETVLGLVTEISGGDQHEPAAVALIMRDYSVGFSLGVKIKITGGQVE